MDYRDIVQYAVTGLGGLILETNCGRKVPAQDIALLEAIETHAAAVDDHGAATVAAEVENHAAAMRPASSKRASARSQST